MKIYRLFISLDPVRVLYSKSSSPKMSVDRTHPDMSEVKKVRVEKTLEVPIGEVVPLGKTDRSPIPTSTARGSVMVANDGRGNFNDVRVSIPGTNFRVLSRFFARTSKKRM